MASTKVISGSVDQVPCPFCGKPNDWRDLEEQSTLDTGHEILCDFCGNIIEVVQIRQVKVISVRQGAPTHPGRQIQQPQRGGLTGAVRKLLNK